MALFLVALTVVTITVDGGMFSPHQKLEETFDNFERAVRFSQDEAVLRNTVVRLNIKIALPGEESTFTVEYASDNDFIIPTQYLQDLQNSSTLDEDEIEERLNDVNKKFSKVQEFQEEPEPISHLVSIIGVGSTLSNTFVSEREANIFFYPSGAKDGAIIVIGNDQEIASLIIEPFTMDFTREYYSIEGDGASFNDIFEFHTQKGRELYEEWLK